VGVVGGVMRRRRHNIFPRPRARATLLACTHVCVCIKIRRHQHQHTCVHVRTHRPASPCPLLACLLARRQRQYKYDIYRLWRGVAGLCARACNARVLVPPNLYIHTYTQHWLRFVRVNTPPPNSQRSSVRFNHNYVSTEYTLKSCIRS